MSVITLVSCVFPGSHDAMQAAPEAASANVASEIRDLCCSYVSSLILHGMQNIVVMSVYNEFAIGVAI